jgi:hypothetical protein
MGPDSKHSSTARAAAARTDAASYFKVSIQIPERIKSPTCKGSDFRTVVESLKIIENILMASCQESDASGP